MTRGWFGQPRKHSHASKKGWAKRRGNVNALYSDRARRELMIKAKRVALKRPEQNLRRDRMKTAKTVLNPDIPYEALKYIKNPSGADLVDTDTFKRQAKIIKKPVMVMDLSDVQDIQKKSGRRGAKKASTQEKKEIAYIMETTGSNYAQARGLRSRAKRKGFSYDVVDWDQLQGKDMTYSDKLRTLEGMVGKTARKGMQYSRSQVRADESRLRDWQRRNL